MVGTEASISIQRVDLCERGFDVTGTERRVTTRDVGGTAGVDLLALGGGLVGGLSSILVANPRDACTSLGACGRAPGASAIQATRTVGIFGISLGVLALIPWVGSLIAGRTTREEVPYTDVEERTSQDCPGIAASGLVVALRRIVISPELGGEMFATRRAGPDGVVRFDLTTEIPAGAMWGDRRWSSVSVVARDRPTEVLSDLALDPVRALIADRVWRAALTTGTPEALLEFASSCPNDPRAEGVPERVRAIRVERERHDLWLLADSETEALQQLVAGGTNDGYGVAATCRLALLDTTLDQMNEAQDRCVDAILRHSVEVRSGAQSALFVDAATSLRTLTDRLAALQRSTAEARQATADAQAAEAGRVAAERYRAQVAEARRVEAERNRARTEAGNAMRSAVSGVLSVVAACRGGSASGASAARPAYLALAQARGTLPIAAVRALTFRIASACHCTPSCAGVSNPATR